MLENEALIQIASRAALAHLGESVVESAFVQPSLDSEGREALRITIVIRPGKVGGLSGDKTLDTLYEIQRELSLAGEGRLAIVEYATRKELKQGAAAQS